MVLGCVRIRCFKMLSSISMICIFMIHAISGDVNACHPCKCVRDKVYGGVKVTCTGLNLIAIPENLPADSTTLLFNNNNLTQITEFTFKKVKGLHILDMSGNIIERIDENAFHGLSELLVLNLSSNRLLLDASTYKPNVFRPLKKLNVLRIEDNNNMDSEAIGKASYPDESFRVLTSLRECFLDGLSADFGPGFVKMTNLKILSLSGRYCQFSVLRNTSFVNVPSVQNLNLSNCHVHSTELHTFIPFKQIRTIDVSNNDQLGFANFTDATFGLQNSSIEVLDMSGISSAYGACSILKKAHLVYLQNTKLEKLYLDRNGILSIEADAVLPKKLSFLSARYNRFQFGSYIWNVYDLTSLTYLDVSGNNNMKSLILEASDAANSSLSLLPVPRNLQTIIISDCSISAKLYPGGLFPNNLRKIIASYNFLYYAEGPQPGMEKVEHLDFSHNVLENITYDYFDNNNSIVNLFLENNFLGRAISEDTKGYMFSRLSKVRILNIPYNRITVIPQIFFIRLLAIETLNISGNLLESFEIDLSKNRNLSVIDVTYNKLLMLPLVTLKELEHVPHVLIQGNPFLCSCSTLHFLRWVKQNVDRIDDLNYTFCRLTTTGSQVSFDKIASIVQKLENVCSISHNTLAISVTVAIFLFILSLVSVSICYHHRWKLRYLYHVGRRAYRQHHEVDHGDDEAYQYDVFVSYAAPDRRFVIDSMMPELETKAALRMCIHDRDFLPGEVIATNIVNAIQNSRKTLVLLSPSFLESDWCEFEYNMARMESVTQRRNIVVVVLYKYTPIKDLPKDMAVMFRNNCYLEYNEEEFGCVVFWENVVEAIKCNGLSE